MENVTSTVEMILDVFTAVLSWFVEAIGLAVPIFYVAGTGLTFIGVITVIALSLAVALLIGAWIRSLMRQRG